MAAKYTDDTPIYAQLLKEYQATELNDAFMALSGYIPPAERRKHADD